MFYHIDVIDFCKDTFILPVTPFKKVGTEEQKTGKVQNSSLEHSKATQVNWYHDWV